MTTYICLVADELGGELVILGHTGSRDLRDKK
jgi:hypothetical protein